MTSLQNIVKTITSPIDPKFNRQILKMSMNDVVKVQLNNPPPSLYKSHLLEEEKTIDILMLMFIKFQDFYNCKTKMSKEQLEETAYIIVNEHRGINFIDVAMCLKLAKTKEKIYDRIDGGMILGWMKDFGNKKTDLIVLERQKQKSKENSEWSGLGERSSVISMKNWMKNDN